MTCRQCKYEWCWMCLKMWKGHNNFYNCTRYEKAKEKAAKSRKNKKYLFQKLEEDQALIRTQLERYLAHYAKFEEYENLLSDEFLEKIKQKMNLYQSQTTLVEVKFLERGAKVLKECHLVLKYCSVYKYFFLEAQIEKERKEREREEALRLSSKKKKKSKNVEEIDEFEPQVQQHDEREFSLFVFTLDELESHTKKLHNELKNADASGPSRKSVLSLISLSSQVKLNLLEVLSDGLMMMND